MTSSFNICPYTGFFLRGSGIFFFLLLFNWVQLIAIAVIVLIALKAASNDEEMIFENKIKKNTSFVCAFLCGILFGSCIYGLFALLRLSKTFEQA